MKVEIWSDVVCPFCYIGKRKFKAALNEFAEAQNVEIEWKSYQLMPDLPTRLDRNIDQILAEMKGVSIDQARQMNAQVTLMGKQAGLVYNLDRAIVANTFKAHQFIHFSKSSGMQNQAEELMFRYYFTDGKNIDDMATLLEAGKSLGLDLEALKLALEKGMYANEVEKDIAMAEKIGVRGVPFFVFNGKYAVSGAQDSKVFSDVLLKSFSEWKTQQNDSAIQVTKGKSCSPTNKCD